MVNILIAFVTGLTTGGLSCLAVQGGLLASSLAGQIEKDYGKTTPKTRRKKQATIKPRAQRTKLIQPIIAFLSAKLAAYTFLGFLLGLVGQMFQLSPYARAFLQIAIGIFMLGSALRMLNVHPIFRYFVFEPPAFLRRKLRRAAAGTEDVSLATPLFLGFLTVLIPCGITQSMMAVALSTANPVEGAVLMFAFTFGTSPTFFAVAYFAAQLGKRLEKHFTRLVAVLVLVLAVITIDSGVTLAGSPISLSRLANSVLRPSAEAGAASSASGPQIYDPASSLFSDTQKPDNEKREAYADEDEIIIDVENYGYVPDVIHARAGIPITLRLITEDVSSCSRAFIIPALGVQQILEQTGEALIEIPAQEEGSRMAFSCSMGMYSGTIIFDL